MDSKEDTYYIDLSPLEKIKISDSNPKSLSTLTIQALIRCVLPCEHLVLELVSKLEEKNVSNSNEFRRIISRLDQHPIVQKMHVENEIISSKFFKRYLRILKSLKSLIMFGLSSNERGNIFQKELFENLDDIIPFVSLAFSKMKQPIIQYPPPQIICQTLPKEKNEVINDSIIESLIDSLLLQLSIIKEKATWIEQFINNWNSILDSGLQNRVFVTENTEIDRLILLASLQEFLEVRSLEAHKFFCLSLVSSDSQLIVKIPRTEAGFDLESNERSAQQLRETISFMYQLNEDSKIFFFDQNYSLVNAISEFEKVRIIKVKHSRGTSNNNNLDKGVKTPLIIGISGSTRSGKGTLCANLQVYFDGDYITQDNYFDYDRIQNYLQGNAESPESINWNKFLEDIDQIKNKPDCEVLILDGFQLFSNPKIVEICDVKIFLDANPQLIYERRMETKPVKESYFWKNIFPEYIKYRNNCLNTIQGIQIIEPQPSSFEVYLLAMEAINWIIKQNISNSFYQQIC